MRSPARDHFQRTLAAQASGVIASEGVAPPMPETGAAAGEHQLLLIALGEDLRELKNLQSVERKIEAKRAMIDRYRPWIDGAMASESPTQDDIISTMLVWAIDIADWLLALDLARHVLAHGIALPERYRRQPAVLIAEEVADAGLRPVPGVDLDTMQRVAELTGQYDMPDQVRAKLHKAMGLAFRDLVEAFEIDAESAPAGGKRALLDAAIDNLTRALGLDKSVGVKKSIETLTRERDKLTQSDAGQQDTST